MKRQLFATGSAVVLAMAAAAAQAPSTQSSSMNQSLTMTGCVKSTSELTSSGAQNPPSASWPPGQFVLTNAMAATSAGEGTRDGNTSAGAPSPNKLPMPPISQYMLRPADSTVNLSSHLNQKVEVTARLAPSTSPETGTRSPGDPAVPGTAPAPPSTGSTTTPGTTPGSTSAPGSSTATAGRMPSASQGAMSSVPTLAVTSIRQVSATCS